MTIFNAYKDANSGELACLPDRFSWSAFLLPPVWAIAHRLWVELALIIAAIIGLAIVAALLNLPFLALYLTGAVWLGFEAHQLQGRALVRRGWQPAGTLSARDRIDAETETGRRAAGHA